MPRYLNIPSWIAYYGGDTIFTYEQRDGVAVVNCLVCHIEIIATRMFSLQRHFDCKRHQKNVAAFRVNGVKEDSEHTAQLTQMLIRCNIPLSTVEHPLFISFIEKYLKKSVPTRFIITKSMEAQGRRMLLDIQASLDGKDIFVSMDVGSPDPKEPPVAAVLIGPLDGTFLGRPFLINLEKDISGVESFVQVVIRSISRVFGEYFDRRRLKVFITKESDRSLQAGEELRNHFPDMLHVICLSEGLNRLIQLCRNKEEVERDVMMANLNRIHVCSKKLSEERLPLHSSMALIDNLTGELPLKPFKSLLKEILHRSPGFERLRDIAERGLQTVYDNAPLVCCDAERVLALMQEVNTSKRQRLNKGHIRDMLMIGWNTHVVAPVKVIKTEPA